MTDRARSFYFGKENPVGGWAFEGRFRKSLITTDIVPRDAPKNIILDAALEYGQRGWRVIPLHWPLVNGKCSCNIDACDNVGKHPTIKDWPNKGTSDLGQIAKWWDHWPQANIGILTGKKHGLLLLDVDIKDDGPGVLAALEAHNGPLPDTVEAITGSGGRHVLFKYPENRKILNKARFKDGLDTRSDGGMFVAAPSLHASGRRYEWDVMFHPDETELANCPEWLLLLMTETNTKGNGEVPQNNTGKSINEGARNSTLTSLAGTMRRRGMSYEAIFAALLEENKKYLPPLDEKEVRMVAMSVSRYPAKSDLRSQVRKSFPYTELGNAEKLIYHHGADLRYCHPWGKWLFWDDRRWSTDTTGEINRRAFATVRQMLAEAADIGDETERKALVKWEQKSESGKVRREMIETSKSINGIPVLPDDLDKHLWALNVNNGEIDLKTGKLLEHKRENLITKLAPVTYDPNAKCPTWESFLRRIMNGNTSLIGFLQRAIGYSLTGDTGEQCLFILYGAGANGKSVFLDTVSALFGEDYAQNTPASTLMVRRNEGIPNDIAALKGARLITAIEAEEGQRLAESLVKSMTGGDKMTARFMRGEFFSFIPEFKLFLATNHKPQIKGTDHAIWRRINLIPFEVTIPTEERDRNLPLKLRKELSGILNWTLEGCLQWQKEGLGIPDEVKVATNFYRDEMDVIGDFLADRCLITPAARVENKDLRMAYERWCDVNGERAITQKAFSTRLIDRGFVSSRSGANGRRAWPGIGLVNEDLTLDNPFTDGF
ncbi:MAG: phage/plasmid primase, P4 family [Desulfosporosinus sp.]|nr:phage/plasmid primase, P4 family [Desulfosporosinus sp.]